MTLSGPDFEVTPAIREHVRRRAESLRRRRHRGRAAAFGVTAAAAAVVIAFTVEDGRPRQFVAADQRPAFTWPSSPAPLPRLAAHLLPARAVAEISTDLDASSMHNVPGEDYRVGLLSEEVLREAETGVYTWWDRSYRLPPDPPVPDIVTAISSQIIEFPDAGAAASARDRLGSTAESEQASRVELANGYIMYVPEIPAAAREHPSSSEWLGVGRKGEFLVVVQLQAIGTADWTLQFADLMDAARGAAAGLGA